MRVRTVAAALIFSVAAGLLSACTAEQFTAPTASPGSAVVTYVPGESTWTVWAKAQAACLTAAGWPSSVDESDPQGPSLHVEVGQGQDDAYFIAEAQCKEEIGGDYQAPAMTADRSKAFYERAGKQHDCLLDHGFESPDPPSLATYQSNWDAKGDFGYNPYSLLVADDLRAGIAACPYGKEP